MCSRGRGDPHPCVDGKRDDPTAREIDRQEHKLLHRRAPLVGTPKHLMRKMQPLRVGAENLAKDTHFLADQQLPLKNIVRLDYERPVIGRAFIVRANTDGIEQHVGRVVEQYAVISKVHMAVYIYPFWLYLASISVEWRLDRHHFVRLYTM